MNNMAEDGAQDRGEVSNNKKAMGAFRTISEVAKELGVQQHVLRFWESKFSQVKPLTRGGGRRYYRPEDVAVLVKIHEILYKEGYTIKGAQKLLRGLSKGQVAKVSLQRPATEQSNIAEHNSSSSGVVAGKVSSASAQGGVGSYQKAMLEAMRGELIEIRDEIKSKSK